MLRVQHPSDSDAQAPRAPRAGPVPPFVVD